MKSFKLFLAEIFGEPSDSNFTHDGNDYDLNGLLSATTGLPDVEFDVAKLTWIFEYDPITKADDERIKNADLRAPILIIHTNDGWVTLDGLHRLAKAVRDGLTTIKAIVVPQELLDRYRISGNQPA